MNASRRLILAGAVGLLLSISGIPFFNQLREANAATTTITWGTNANCNDGVGACVAPPGKTCAAGSTWGSGGAVTLSAGNVVTITLDAGYTIAVGAIKYGTTLASATALTTGTDPKLGSSSALTSAGNGTNSNKITFTTAPSSAKTLYINITPPTGNWDVAYNIVDAGTLAWADPPPSAVDHGYISVGSGSAIRIDALPDNTPVPTSGSTGRPIVLNFTPDAYYAIQQVDYSTNGGTSWTAVSGTGVTGTDATTNLPVTACVGTTGCSWSYSPGASTMVRVAFKPWSVTINVSYVTTAGTGYTTPAPTPSTGGTVTVTKNDDQAFTITANAGSRILDVKVQDATAGITTPTSQGPITSYTFKNVAVNSDSLQVTFAPDIAHIDNYCQTPAFIGSSTTGKVLPNVMLIFDNSQSMSYDAYTTNTCDPTKSYYGYFKNNRLYSYDSASKTYSDVGPYTYVSGTPNPLWGNCLNLTAMTRYDVVRAATIGGKMKAGTRGTSDNIIEGFKDCRIGNCSTMTSTPSPYYVHAGATEPTGVVQDLTGKVNYGLMFFNPGGQYGGYVQNTISTATTAASIVTSIEGQNPVSYTPLAETLYEAVRYFQHGQGFYTYGAAAPTGRASPATTASGAIANYASNYDDPIQYNCQKNFVLIVTDDLPNEEAKIPGVGSKKKADGVSSYSTVPWSSQMTGCDTTAPQTTTSPVFNADSWLDKIYQNESPSSVPAIDPEISASCHTDYLEAVAYFAHNADLRVETTMGGSQNLTIYGVFAFNDAGISPPLINSCKYGAFKDSDASGTPNRLSEWYTRKNADGTSRTHTLTCTSSDPCPNVCSTTSTTNKLTGTLTSGTCVFQLPDTYYEAGEGANLRDALYDAMKSIIAQVSSGTAASILSNSSGSGANLLQAVFYPDKVFELNSEVTWTGEMQNLWYYVDPFLNKSSVHEDTDQDNIFDLATDYEVQFNFNGTQTLADLIDAGGTKVRTGWDPDRVKPLWRAGKMLWAKSPASRNIFTYTNATSSTPTLVPLTAANKATLAPYLQVAPTSVDPSYTEAENVISYIRGSQVTNWRDRTAIIGSTTNQWKLGDIISSTPRTQSSLPLNLYDQKPAAGGYSDTSYTPFISSANYANRGTIYTGANDGMLHAFRLGTLEMLHGSTVTQLAQLTGGTTGNPLGGEEWAYIPRNALPYLRYLADPTNYDHVYYVDGTPTLLDASIAKPTGCGTAYYDCVKPTDGSNWKTVLVAGMGLGGASRSKLGTCTDCVKTPITDPDDTVNNPGLGYSSYFALDVTGQYFNPSNGTRVNDPQVLWEFSDNNIALAADKGLGYSTSGAAIVRISAQTSGVPVKTKNGRWFAVFGSGPTGPITGVQFIGKSDQRLKFYVVDLGATPPFVKNTNYWVLDSGIDNAFAGSITNGVIDTDRWNVIGTGNYQDDAIYVGYTNSTDSWATSTGGILRIATAENPDPTKWKISTVISGIGPVTTNIGKLQDRKKHKLWLFAGTGRYFASGEDAAPRRMIMGISDPCYKQTVTHGADSSEGNGAVSTEAIDEYCTTSVHTCTVSDLTGTCMQEQTTGAVNSLPANSTGWYIQLDPQDTVNLLGAERIVSDPVALTNGSIFFTSFKPTSNACDFGGKTYLWGVNYNTGYELAATVKTGKALMQQSTGSFNQLDIKGALTDKEHRRTSDSTANAQGKPPADAPPMITNANLKPVKKFLHVQER